MKSAVVPLLSLVMLGMGLTLTWENFKAVLNRPRVILLGVAMQFVLMPLYAWAVSLGLGLPMSALIGMVLVGCSPGGTASNVICYLAGADVALSITLTMTSTVLAVIATPALIWLILHQTVPVPAGSMFLSVLQIVLIPVLLGTTLNSLFRRAFKTMEMVFPLVSVLAILLIIGIIVALNRDSVRQVGPLLMAGVMIHNGLGLISGYIVARLFRMDRRTARTLSIEVGMQNSGLGVALAMKYFSAAAAVPGAIFSIWHNLSGALLARFWKTRSEPLKSAKNQTGSEPAVY